MSHHQIRLTCSITILGKVSRYRLRTSPGLRALVRNFRLSGVPSRLATPTGHRGALRGASELNDSVDELANAHRRETAAWPAQLDSALFCRSVQVKRCKFPAIMCSMRLRAMEFPGSFKVWLRLYAFTSMLTLTLAKNRTDLRRSAALQLRRQ